MGGTDHRLDAGRHLPRTVQWAVADQEIQASFNFDRRNWASMGTLAPYAGLSDFAMSEGDQVFHPPGISTRIPALLNILRITDIAEIAGARFAPSAYRSRSPHGPPPSTTPSRSTSSMAAPPNLNGLGAFLKPLEIWKAAPRGCSGNPARPQKIAC